MSKVLIFLLSVTILLSSCKNEVNKAEGEATITGEVSASYGVNVNVEEAKSLASSNAEVVWLDVRTPEEVALGKIDGAMEVDFNDPAFSQKVGALDKEKEYIVYCAAGGRSSKAVELMQQMGFSRLHNLTEGYTGWSQQQ
jgi:phage shock protein E